MNINLMIGQTDI